MYCDRCGTCICAQCRSEVHNTHKVISLTEKGELLREELRTSVDRMKAESGLIEQAEQLQEMRHVIEFAATEASNQIKQYHRNVTRKLMEVLRKQYITFDDQKEKQMREIDDEEKRICDIIQQMDSRKADIYSYLHQAVSPKFIRQCKEDLAWAASYQDHQDKWKEPNTVWKQSVFVPPEAPSMCSSDYLDHCEKFILGYFDFVYRDMEERRKEESANKRNREETRISSLSLSPSFDNAQNYRRFDSVDTLHSNDRDEYATQYTASYGGRSVTSQNVNLYEDVSTIVLHETNNDTLYEEVGPQIIRPFLSNVPQRRAPSSSEYIASQK